MKKNSLFRQEAIDSQKQKWVGKALLLSGIPAWIIALASSVFIFVLILLLIFLDYTRRIDVAGEIITLPHAVNVFSPQQGYIVRSFVKVGDMVNRGDPLYDIDVSRVTSSGNVGRETKNTINNQIENINSIITKTKENKRLTLKNLQEQLDRYVETHKETEKLIASARDGVEKMRQGMTNYDKYQRSGLITKDQLNNQRFMFYQQQSGYQSLNSQGIQEGLQISRIRSDILTQSADFDNQISQNEYQRNDLQRRLVESDAGDTLIINAQLSGQVESLSVTAGQMINVGSSLAQLTPTKNKQYFLMLWLPNSALPYVNIGDRINIRYDAFPAEKFGQFPGRIETVSYIPASRQELSEYSSGAPNGNGLDTENFYKVLVSLPDVDFSLKNKTMKLSNGLKARTIVFLEKRPLYQWMFTPFYNIKNSVAGKIDE
ncbi:MAG: HlyD family secretion protein [Serratia inhibens]|uniref:HlyD family secretion protein n=1 Tax=Serratia inhibens TaxID=2338073 RepID=UPI003C7BF043